MGIDINTAQLDPHLSAMLERELALAAKQSGEIVAARKRAGERAPGKYDENAEPEGIVDNPNDLHSDYHASTVILVKDVGSMLNKHYPGWAWTVQVNEAGHMLDIFNLHCHTSYGYRIRMVDIMYDPARHEAMKGGGEILERFGLPRTGLTPAAGAILAAAARDVKGNLIPDISDTNDKRMKLNAEIARKLDNGDIQIFDLGGQKVARIKNDKGHDDAPPLMVGGQGYDWGSHK